MSTAADLRRVAQRIARDLARRDDLIVTRLAEGASLSQVASEAGVNSKQTIANIADRVARREAL